MENLKDLLTERGPCYHDTHLMHIVGDAHAWLYARMRRTMERRVQANVVSTQIDNELNRRRHA